MGDEFKGYVFRISGGNDKQGFPMRQGVLTDQRVRLLLKKGSKCYRARRKVSSRAARSSMLVGWGGCSESACHRC